MAESRTTARGTILTYVMGLLALVCIIGAAGDFFFVAQYSVYDSEFLNQASTFLLGAYERDNETWAVLSLRDLVESEAFLQAAS